VAIERVVLGGKLRERFLIFLLSNCYRSLFRHQWKWEAIFQDHFIAAAILEWILHHWITINIQGESYHMKDRKNHKLLTNREESTEKRFPNV